MSLTKRLWEDEQEKKLAEMRSEIAWEYGLHEDDDGDTIEDLLAERIQEMEKTNEPH